MLGTMPHVRSGRLRALGVTSAKRVPSAPDIPTIAESGLPGFKSDIWFALLAPAETPAPVIGRLNKALNEVLAAPDTIARLRELGGDPMGGTPERATALMKEDQLRWHKVIKDVGIKSE